MYACATKLLGMKCRASSEVIFRKENDKMRDREVRVWSGTTALTVPASSHLNNVASIP